MSTSKSGLSGAYAKGVFVLLVELSALTAYLVCKSDYGLIAIKVQVLINLIGLIALSSGEDEGDFFSMYAGFALGYGPLLVYAAFVQSPLL